MQTVIYLGFSVVELSYPLYDNDNIGFRKEC